MMFYRKFWIAFAVMIWLTGLAVWGVNKIVANLEPSKTFSLQSLPSVVTTQQYYAVAVGDNTVWIIDRSSRSIEVIKFDGQKFVSELLKLP